MTLKLANTSFPPVGWLLVALTSGRWGATYAAEAYD
jgi:hypothetical protein